MTNQQVAQAWVSGSKSGKNSNGSLFYEGDTIYSYGRNHKIAVKTGDVCAHVNSEKYSSTTSRQTSLVKKELEKQGYKILNTNMNKITKLNRGIIDCHGVYLDWVNNYLTLDRMASDYGFSHEFLESCIEHGRSINQKQIYVTV